MGVSELSAPRKKVLPQPRRAVSLGVRPDAQLKFGFSGTLCTVQELQAARRNKLDCTYTVTGPGSLFHALGDQQTVLRACSGRISPLAVVRLSAGARARAGIPAAAHYYALAYPAKRLDMLRTELSLDEQPWGGLLLMGVRVALAFDRAPTGFPPASRRFPPSR